MDIVCNKVDVNKLFFIFYNKLNKFFNKYVLLKLILKCSLKK